MACVPYDVVNAAEAAALAAGKPHSLLHVDRAEIDLPADTDPHSDAACARALEAFRKLQAEGVLVRESGPSLYLYRQQMGEHQQYGLVAVCSIEDYDSEIIKKHEKTRKDKEDDRTRLIDTLSANTGPVFLTYRDTPAPERADGAPGAGKAPARFYGSRRDPAHGVGDSRAIRN